MAKRIIDGDAMWASDKLAHCPLYARREYPWLYSLADARGCFEITNLKVIHGRVAAIRDDLTLQLLSAVFNAYREHGLMFTWKEEGKEYAFWVGSDKRGSGRLPSLASRKSKVATPPVPKDGLSKYLISVVNQNDSDGIHAESGRALGFGFGSGSGLGSGSGCGGTTAPPENLPNQETATPPVPEPRSAEPTLAEQGFECLAETFRLEKNTEPAFVPMDVAHVEQLFRVKPDLTVAELQRRYLHMLQGGNIRPLRFFCADFDSFIDPPRAVARASPTPKTFGRQAAENMQSNLSAGNELYEQQRRDERNRNERNRQRLASRTHGQLPRGADASRHHHLPPGARGFVGFGPLACGREHHPVSHWRAVAASRSGTRIPDVFPGDGRAHHRSGP